ncbi:MAG: Hpt domain-containing protein [Chloroflexi bacterium]|nr:Hpt domain-containing protein [Chloroflexota bacterium]MCH9038476.1 Hpt domain-containing protein [Chloroflexota bacterium]MCI0841283.1 Hpt domain-containing protein [Chloroflexota bacterium]
MDETFGNPTGGPGPFALIEKEEALARMDNDENLLREIIGIFLKHSESYLDNLRHSIMEGDSDEVYRTAHTLKGAVGNFPANAAFEAALRLEMMGRAGDMANAKQAYLELEGLINRLKPALENIFEGE